jgi:hypothetical protein
MKPLDKVYSSPAELLAKARRDRDALVFAADAGDEISLRDKLFDFSVTAYHIVDWLKSYYPQLEALAYSYLDSTPALQACRDIANSHKHHALDVAKGSYRKFPPVIDHLDYSLGATASPRLVSDVSGETQSLTSGAHLPRRLKAQFVGGGRLRVEDIAKDAVVAWELFFALHGIA